MKRILKGVAVAAIVMVALIVISMCCNMHGIELDSVSTGTISAVCAMLLYSALNKNKKKSRMKPVLADSLS